MEQIIFNLEAICRGNYDAVVNPTLVQKTLMWLDKPSTIQPGDMLDGATVAIKACPFRVYDFSQTPELCLLAVLLNPETLKYVDPTIEHYDLICEKAVFKSGSAIAYVKKQTPEMIKRAIVQNTTNIRYLIKQTYPDCLYVIDNGFYNVIQYIRPPDGTENTLSPLEYEHICLKAIEKSDRGRAIYKIRPENRTMNMIFKAIDKDVTNIVTLPKTHEAYMALMTYNGNLIRYLDEDKLTLEICVQAIKTSGPFASVFIKNLEMAKQALSLAN